MCDAWAGDWADKDGCLKIAIAMERVYLTHARMNRHNISRIFDCIVMKCGTCHQSSSFADSQFEAVENWT
jgi:hypothetical protein